MVIGMQNSHGGVEERYNRKLWMDRKWKRRILMVVK
jgi:hypothetical protein